MHIIPIEKCNELYNKCKVGFCISASNPSRIPFEMMAAGLPVVEMYRENNLYDMPDDGVLLAEPTPEGLASAIVHLLDSPEECKKMSEFGKKFMKDYPLEKGFTQFLEIVKAMVETDYNDPQEIKLLYTKKPFLPSEESKQVVFEEIKENPIPVDNHGKVYRILRKCYRAGKKIIKH